MDIIEKFGNRVSSQALKDPEKARRLLLAGYRLQEKKLQFLPDRGLPSSGQYVARVVMKNIIQSLSEPENAAMVSIFVPGELVMAAGLDGIEKGMALCAPDRPTGISLPDTLQQAAVLASESPFLKTVLPEGTLRAYLAMGLR